MNGCHRAVPPPIEFHPVRFVLAVLAAGLVGPTVALHHQAAELVAGAERETVPVTVPDIPPSGT
ncbi:hypothetical protein [Streptomyces sp. cg36]|uniref:hypothetical protein n=1 Tax=Streptomyces sp. cg36 TaxID=3238798 RepID=UPI0034E28BE4